MIDLVLKNAQEQELCDSGSKVMIFTAIKEGQHGELVNFALKEIDPYEEVEEEAVSGDSERD